ncbi:heme biosynthesis HemY N-terminal domain-containing protein [Rivibacter subsaxonicus]|uniref:HemY protein n=1 Tax=Rivibacter subsaxonicus TaxID=457575 RepID=A0A4Q7W0V8_9BURK|nr:heme biosynthesis HemY N-terminal domain-containing protein [Rivibacter subsaxonicus]RZU02831.1 HemY protein [Rivibacter subsaxonicus]
MRTVIWLLLLAGLAALAATLLGSNDNTVTIYWAPWRLDLSLNFFILLLVLALIAGNILLQGITALAGMPRRAREWRVARRDRTAQAALRDSIAQFFGGRYGRAHKAAQRAVAIQADTPELASDREFTALGHLLAAGSLHRLQDRVRRDEQLERALAIAQSAGARAAEEGAQLLAAEWALDDRNARRTLELLAQLPPGVSRRTQALRLKLQAARLAQQPVEALRTARLLAKHQAFSAAAAQGLLRALAGEAIDATRDVDQLKRVWREFETADRRDVLVAARAAQHLVALGVPEEARAWLRPFWDRLAELPADERRELALALARAVEGIGPEWLPRLESALQAYPGDAAIGYAVGRAFASRELWGKARQLLEPAAASADLESGARREAWLLLAAMAERDDDHERAGRAFRSAAALP